MNQAMEVANVARRTIYFWMEKGKVEIAGRTAGGSLRLYKDSLWQKKEEEKP